MAFINWVLKEKNKDVVAPEPWEIRKQKELEKKAKIEKKLKKLEQKKEKKKQKKILKIKKQVEKQNNNKLSHSDITTNPTSPNHTFNVNVAGAPINSDYTKKYLESLEAKRRKKEEQLSKKKHKKLKMKIHVDDEKKVKQKKSIKIVPLTPCENDKAMTGVIKEDEEERVKDTDSNKENTKKNGNSNPYLDLNLMDQIQNEIRNDVGTPLSDWNPFDPSSPKPSSDAEWADFDKTFFGF